MNQIDELSIPNIREIITNGGEITVKNLSNGTEFKASCELSSRQKDILLAGGLLNYTRIQNS